MEPSPAPENPEPEASSKPEDTVVDSSHSALADQPVEPPSTTAWHTGLQPIEAGLPVGLDTLSTAAVNDQYFSNNFRGPATPVDSRNTTSPAASLASANNLNFILNHSGSSASPSMDSVTLVNQNRSSSTLSHAAIMGNSKDVVSERETAFLLRQFAENTGDW